MKKLLLLFVMMLLPLVASAVEIDGINYKLNSENKTAEVIQRSNYSGDIVIPEKVTYDNSEYSVTSIGNYAFSSCTSLTSITILNSVTSIGNYAFYKCTGLTSITIPNSVTSIGESVFYGCSELTSVTFHCKQVSNWFSDMPQITNVELGEEVEIIGNSAFSQCTGLTSITIPNSVTSIGNSAFSSCTGLTSITIPNSVTSIGDNAFYKCSSLTSITIPNSVTSIGYYAFRLCGLTSITIPNSVTSIGKDAFSLCGSLTSVTFHCKQVSNWFSDMPQITNVELGEEVEIIDSEAFSSCSGLSTITIPNSVKSIGVRAFNGCTSLTSITIPNSVTSIGESAFSSCTSLTSITIPNSVTSIGGSAFSSCTSLTSITIPNSVTSIGNSVFYNSNIKKTFWLTNTPPSGFKNANGAINYVANNQYSSLSNVKVYPYLSSIFEVDGIKYVPVSPSERTCDAIDCSYDSNVKSVRIPQTVTYKGISMSVLNMMPYICYGNTNIETAELGDNIISIEDYAFYGCSSLKGITIPRTTTSIGNYAFAGCELISKISVPQSVKTIGNNVFEKCKGLKELIIEDRGSELSLGYNYKDRYSSFSPLFADCPLDSVYIGGNITYETSSKYGYSPFYRNTTLRTVVITDKETEISANEFYGCTNLQSFTVGDAVTTFGDWAFSGCSSLKSLTFGSNLQTIGKEAFSDCASVVQIVSKAKTPPTCGTQALDDINKWTCNVFVPKGCLSAYQAAEQWKEFFFLQEGEGKADPVGPTVKTCAKPTISYENGKLTFSCDTEGATCHSTITNPDINSFNSNEVQLGVTYTINVYAAKSGYANSETATATLCWIDAEPKKEGITGDIANVQAHAVMIQCNGGVLTIQGADDGTPVSVYNVSGIQQGAATISNGSAVISTNIPSGSIAIVKIGQKSVKVVMK